jgi:hypothetical protein
VKQICDSYQFRIEYSFQNGLHDFTIIYNWWWGGLKLNDLSGLLFQSSP